MIQALLPLLGEAIPAGVAIKKLMAKDSRLGNFIQGGLAAGYGADQLVKFLRNKSQTPGQRADVAALQRGEASGTLRPDEMARLSELRQREEPGKAASTAAGLAGGVLGAMAPISDEKPTAAGIISDVAKRSLTPERAYKAFVDAGHGDKLDLIASRAGNMENAYEWGQKLIPEDVFSVMGQMFDADPQQIFQTAMKHSISQRGKKRGGKADLLGVEAPAEAAPQQQGSSADQELLAAIQNLRNMMGGQG